MDINWYEVFIQLIGVFGIIAGLSAFQCNKHSHALILKMTEEGFFGIQYLLLGGYTGAVSDGCNLISVIIGIIRYDIMKKEE